MRVWVMAGVLALGAVSAAGAQTLTTEEKADLAGMGTVSTHAEARTRLPNTVADVTFGIEATGKDVASVSRELSTRSGTLVGYLRGVGGERLRTGQVSVQPQNHTAKNGEESIVGYSGEVTVSLRIAADKLGEVTTGALAHGANQVQQSTLTPRETEMDAARRTLAVEATKTALDEAKAVTAAAGERVFAVKNVQVGSSSGPVRPMVFRSMAKMADAAMPAPIDTAAGDAEITVNVDVTLTIVH